MQEIQTKAIQMYAKNIEYLTHSHPDTLHKITTFEQAIENQSCLEKYSLEYKENYFDVMEIASGSFLYNDNSLAISKQLTNRVNYNKDSYIFDGFAMFNGYENHRDEFDDKVRGLEGIYPLMSYYLQHIQPDSKMEQIEKFIFIGVGLGMHIIEIDNKISAEEYLIIEDDLELFRLSLFTTPYYQLGNRATFCIQENKEVFTETFKKFLSMSFFRNKYLKYSYFNAHSDEKIKLIKNVLSSQTFSSFPYKTLLEKLTRQLSFMKQNYKYINLSQQLPLSPLSEKPLLILAAGPSFSKHCTWLQEHHGEFIVMAVSSVLNKLSQLGIKPDIVTHLDGFEIAFEHFKGYDAKKLLRESVLIAGSFTQQNVLDQFTKENIYLIEELETNYHEGFGSYTGPCVGSTTLIEALLLHLKHIYTLGLDLAISDDGNSHASSHSLTDTRYDTSKMDQLTQSISFRGDFFKVKGNFQSTVYTNPLFYSSLHALNTAIPVMKNEQQNIYNLSEGAYIQETIPLAINDLTNYQTLSKKQVHNEIVQLLNQYAASSLSTEDIQSMHKRMQFAKDVKSILLSFQKNINTTDKYTYLHNLISIILEILQDYTRENRNLITVYEYFFNYATPIIFDFFNTKDLQNTQQHIKNINKMFFDEMLEIENIYESRIKSFLESL